ncbi:organic cation transporter protein [Hyalella azteca]|uniref:Organic cation transporter protein n=1 Tax=Hyalella azteca TaxID=294128 RepID=A0A8B7N4K1_HYAAZ|nr:organic cation transporter protein [Hyalella azteca]
MAQMDVEATLNRLGSFGRSHLLIAALSYLTVFFVGMPALQDSFLNYTPAHRCYVPSCDSSNTTYEDDFLNFTTPSEDNEWDKCEYHSPLTNETIAFNYASRPVQILASLWRDEEDEARSGGATCEADHFAAADVRSCDHGWVYDHELFQSSTTMDFDLVCDKSFLTSMTTSAYNAGMMLGAITSGVMADRLGRRLTHMLSLVLLVTGSSLGAASTGPVMLILLRLLTGFGGISVYTIIFVICAEYMPQQHRSVVGLLISVSFALGEAAVGVYAIFIRRWRMLQLTISLPMFVLGISYWVLPESARWLMTQGREQEAEIIVRKMAKFNKISNFDIVYLQEKTNMSPDDVKQESKNVLNLLKTPYMRTRSLILFYAWFTTSMVYYGISNNVGNLDGNIFVNFIATMLIEIPATLLMTIVFDRLGHKVCLVGSVLIAGAGCFSTAFLPAEASTVIVVLSLIGKFGAAAAFSALYVYASEVFPTSHRSTGLGCCSVFASFAGVIAPLVDLLGKLNPALPLLLFGILAAVSAFSMLFLPETTGCPLTQTLSESEQLGSGQPCCFFPSCTSYDPRSVGEDQTDEIMEVIVDKDRGVVQLTAKDKNDVKIAAKDENNLELAAKQEDDVELTTAKDDADVKLAVKDENGVELEAKDSDVELSAKVMKTYNLA